MGEAGRGEAESAPSMMEPGSEATCLPAQSTFSPCGTLDNGGVTCSTQRHAGGHPADPGAIDTTHKIDHIVEHFLPSK